MDESNVVMLGPNFENRDMTEQETLNEAAGGIEDTGSNPEIVNMKTAMEECIFEFSKKLDSMFKNFENKISQGNATPILGRGIGESTPRASRTISRPEDLNNSHINFETSNLPRETVENVSCKIKPQLYDGSDDLDEYLTQFNLLAELNNWKDKTKALFLASSLKGGARALLNEMSDGERHSFDDLVDALKNRFGSINRSEVFRAELQTRVRNRNETLPELAQGIKQLTRRAYPGTSPVVRDTLALDYFIDAIPETEIRLRLREVGPKTINEAENIAVRLEALRIADRQKSKSVRVAEAADGRESSNEISELRESVKHLRNEVSDIKTNKGGNKNRNGNHKPWNNNYRSNNYQGNENYRRTENWPDSSSRVGTQSRQTGPIQ